MTTYHDPTPMSRRAARQTERIASEHERSQSFAVQPTPFAHPSTHPPQAPAQHAPRSSVEPPASEPQGSMAVPNDDGPPFRRRRVESAHEAELLDTEAITMSERPSYRRRDYSPEGRRSAASASQPDVAPTSQRAGAPASSASSPPTAAPAPTHGQRLVEHTLTRRELRALRAQQEHASEAQWQPVARSDQPVDIAQPVPPAHPTHTAETDQTLEPLLPQRAPEPAPSTGLTQAIAEFDSLTRARPLADSAASLPFLLGPTSSTSSTLEATPDPADVTGLESTAGRPIEPPAASTWTVPHNHWSRQLDLDHEAAAYESTINRTVGATNPTTNALMLPAIPHGDIRGALTHTGEVMLTGSIDLPRTLAATGSTIRLEHSGIDALFEESDHEEVDADSAPVRASRAVSSRTDGTLTPTQKPKQSKAFTVLLVTAVGLAVVVTGLVVAALVFNLF